MSKKWRFLRQKILKINGYHCNICGKTAGRFEVDHKIPLLKGGKFDDLANLQVLCRNCHLKKTKIDLGKKAIDGPKKLAWKKFLNKI